jgi:hypothetical protein
LVERERTRLAAVARRLLADNDRQPVVRLLAPLYQRQIVEIVCQRSPGTAYFGAKIMSDVWLLQPLLLANHNPRNATLFSPPLLDDVMQSNSKTIVYQLFELQSVAIS